MIPKNFKEWACSLSGCDGGQPKAETWLCGIEWGGGSYDDGIYYRKELAEEINAGKYTPAAQYDWNKTITGRSPFGRGFAKLYTSLQGEADVSRYYEFAHSKWTGSEVFKLNLYPIAFDSTDPALWCKLGLDELTGFSEKYAYQAWCMFERFKYFAGLRREHSPKEIICVGVGYFQEFLLAFGADGDDCHRIQSDVIEPISTGNKGRPRRYHWTRIGDTNLVVIPFFSGSNGLNSDHLLREMGERIRGLRSR
jgi:hypothetical protein